MAETILYGTRLSPFVEKVARALALKKIPFRLVPPSSPMDLRKWNPQTGKIPAIDLGGERLWDSTFILARTATVPRSAAVRAGSRGRGGAARARGLVG
jgi:glutathione S-transferase